VPDSGGPGVRRGGLGQEIALEVTGDRPIIASLRPDKVRHPPPGIAGGAPGMAGAYSLNGAAVAVVPQTLSPGDVYRMRLPGGGGWGDPKARDRARLIEDVRNGYVTREAAARDYGVTLADADLAPVERNTGGGS
jgi:N-methylhydantoinase B